nr:iron-sulfur cluster assembly 1 homolog, mitochondrial [Pelodiscus sinensis]|eukprot:XP_025033651.1 iron-sulfur cluster assembly 1 homolog, mitochondrial [Pelodiscus sinensis]
MSVGVSKKFFKVVHAEFDLLESHPSTNFCFHDLNKVCVVKCEAAVSEDEMSDLSNMFRMDFCVTPSAVEKIKQLLKDKPEHVGVKVGVRTRGCNGLSYKLDYTKTKGDSDEEVVQDGVRVFIEKKAQLTLLGTEMDYVEDKLSSEFVFNNPNIKGTCGCGESFNV